MLRGEDMLSARLCFAIDLLIIIWMVNVSIFWIAEYSVSFDVAMYSGGDHHLYNQEWHMPHPDPTPQSHGVSGTV